MEKKNKDFSGSNTIHTRCDNATMVQKSVIMVHRFRADTKYLPVNAYMISYNYTYVLKLKRRLIP